MTEQNKASATAMNYSKKVWIAAAIVASFILLFLFVKMVFSLLLLSLAGIIIAVYFHGCAGLIQRKTKASAKWSLFFSISINILLISVFLWFTGTRLQNQMATLSDTLPETIENAKSYLHQTTIGVKF